MDSSAIHSFICRKKKKMLIANMPMHRVTHKIFDHNPFLKFFITSLLELKVRHGITAKGNMMNMTAFMARLINSTLFMSMNAATMIVGNMAVSLVTTRIFH